MPNRLAHETSPYLQQHAENPVDWYPWGDEALARARSQGKPILLSIGYSACHWCHVMAHESFEDPETAAEMNRLFVNVKVDREERPDLDQIYQTAHQLLSRRAGGWPLTVVLMPDGTPFFAGTYFPKTPRYGMPGFRELLGEIAQAYRERRSDIEAQNTSLLKALESTTPGEPAADALTRDPIDAVVPELAQVFDAVNGGIGGAPKFPHPYELGFCLRRHVLDADSTAGTIAKVTLTKMAEGGIYDHLGGGFFRYSTDEHWTIPHFEKMLYDNGPLLALYADAWCVTRDPLFERVVRETAGWIMREMQPPASASEGGYYSSLDADSEGEEGKHYVWTTDEIRALLAANESAVARRHFGLDRPPNFEQRHWHLRIAERLVDGASALTMPVDACEMHLESARAKLLEAREKRVRPGRDEKVLTSWNALAMKAMARAGRVFREPQWVLSAQRAAGFIRSTLWRDGRLLATWKDGRAHLNAYLDDHAFLLDALLELLQTEFRTEDLDFARSLADLLLEQFEDRERGGFWFVSHDHERLIHRSKTAHDNATPSGNGIAAFGLQRLGQLIGETRYLDAAERALKVFYAAAARSPAGHASLLTALEEALSPPRIVIVRGTPAALAPWEAALATAFRPDTMIVAIPDTVKGLPQALDKAATGPAHDVSAWVCQGVTCLPPVFELAGLERVIAGASG
jgi:uncharacterized protein YyaL (SSP411 family)